MSEPVINLLNQENPQDLDHQQENKEENKKTEVGDYILHQSYFTKHQLINQPNFQVINFNGNFDNSQVSQGVYMGGTHMNMYHGWGILILKNTVFQGKFSLGHKMGKGYMKFPNKSIYVGDFTNDKPHGQGMMQYGDQYFIGDFQNGAMQGDGLWKNKKGQKFVGCWRNNKAHGYGIYSTEQSHYQGEFANFVKHGYGIQNFPNGDVFRGNYIHGKPHGKGQYYWSNGASYKGQFLKGFRQGQGTWISQAGDKYIGHFSGDRKNGSGEYNWANGNSYRGQFCEDMREGQGQMIWNDGSTYNGQWQRGLPHGKGIFKVKGEKPRAGFFQDNVMISESRQKEYKGNEPISTHHRDSLILAMIPEVSRKNRKRKLFSEKKSTKNPFPVSTSSTMSFMKSKSKNRTWRSRQK